MRFSKPPKTYKEQIAILRTRGLIIEDEDFAVEILKTINYYRFSAYYLPFQKEQDVFNPETKFTDILKLYKFDKNLRILFLDAIENAEITIRTKIAYHLAHKYGAFGYIKPENFSKSFKHYEWLRKFKEDSVKRTHEKFIKSYFQKYTHEKNLPIWMVTEITSFGQISIFYSYLKKEDRQSIANKNYRIDEQVLTSWLHTLVYIRNICAHHSRLWNRILSIEPKIPKKLTAWESVSNKKLFCVFLILKRLLLMPAKWNRWIENYKELTTAYPDTDTNYMGFPDNWEDILKNE